MQQLNKVQREFKHEQMGCEGSACACMGAEGGWGAGGHEGWACLGLDLNYDTPLYGQDKQPGAACRWSLWKGNRFPGR